ncbi:MAG: tetratricopeptide repeat protein [Spirochaetaceae bacterium]
MRPRAGIVTGMCLLLLGVSGPDGAADATETDQALSRVYANYALSALDGGRFEEARSFAETSLEFDEENADAHHILARSLSDIQAETGRVVRHLEESVQAGGFRVTDGSDARLLLAETYLRTDRASEALEVLEPPAVGAPQAASTYLTARALLDLGEVEEAEEAALRGRRLYPDDPRFVLFLLRRDSTPGPRTGRWLDANVSEDPAYLESLLYYAARVGDSRRALELTERYLELGGEDPRVAVIRARAAGERSREEAWELFVRLDGLEDKSSVEEMYDLLPAGRVKDRVRAVLADYDGTAERDEERDGFWEERFVFSDGSLERWEVDRNQDGVTEYEVVMSARVPGSLETSPEGYRIRYGGYPEIDVVEVRDDDRLRRYRVLPGRLTYRILSEDLDWGTDTPDAAFPFRLSREPPVLSEELLRENAFRLELGAPEGPVTRVRALEEGAVLGEVVDEDADGRIDHVIAYEEGARVAGLRDADHDGRFEVVEQYEDDQLSLRLVDLDGDDTFEYRERLQPEARVSWDYDGDGVIDAGELRVGRSEVLRQLSLGDDGDFETSMTIYREAVPNE